MGLKPLTYEDPLYQLLRDGNIKEFNRQKARGEPHDLTSCDLRYLDLRGLDAAGIDFSGGYFRAADLRGIDFSQTHLEGASINGARISGAYFPAELSAQEIVLSIEHGTRLRYGK
jgi:uncharacterized protein YjbI with pentapeptide repeats